MPEPTQKSAFDTPWFNSQDRSFFNTLNKSKIARLVLTAETEDFDEEVTQQWRAEGFDTAYVPLLQGGGDYIQRVHNQGDSFGVAEYYGIVAYGDAANLILAAHTKPNNPRLCGIVAYYPSTIPAVTTKYPASVKVLVHLAGGEVGVTKHPEVLGIQAKAKTVNKNVGTGVGIGGNLRLSFKTYVYPSCEPGFAEHDLEEYDPISDSLAFTRSLGLLHQAFRIEPSPENIRDDFVDSTRACKHDATRKTLMPYAHVIHAPTLTGGVGTTDLARFYASFFAPLPKSFASRLLSRTIGTDRVVDEMSVTFVHASPVPWMLPGVPLTNRRVEIVVVSILCVRNGKLESEHVYWDQASVLVQVGLLSPKAVPEALKEKGMKALPIVGAEGSRAVKRGSSKQINGLIAEWSKGK